MAGTPVWTGAGVKAIEQLQKGDWVLSSPEDDPNGPVEWRRVEEVFVNRAAVVYVDVQGQRIGTTAPHGFGVEDRGWIPAGELRAGDVLRSHDGQRPLVEAVSEPGEVVPVYNLKVEGYHTYFVGCPEWGFSVWVHNGDGDACGLARIQQYDPKTKAQVQGRNNFEGGVRSMSLKLQPGQRPGAIVEKLEQELTDLRGNGIVYVLRDGTTGEVFKVGKATGDSAPRMFGSRYASSVRNFAEKNGITINLVVDYVVLTKDADPLARDRGKNLTQEYERQLRSAYKDTGHALLWDNTKGHGTGVGGLGEPWKNPAVADLWMRKRIQAPK